MADQKQPEAPDFAFVAEGSDSEPESPKPAEIKDADAPEQPTAAPDPMFDPKAAFFDESGHLTDDQGLPRIPGTDDRLERHPFSHNDPNDPDHQEMLGELQPATAMNLCCMVGPCDHYREVIIDEPTADENQWSVLRRICRHYQDHESDWDLSEEQIHACGAYDPPWWSLRGRLRQVINRTELALARKKLSPDWKQWSLPESLTALAVSKVLGAVGLYPDRKNIEVARSTPDDLDEMEDEDNGSY
jgi:hypothetical protein